MWVGPLVSTPCFGRMLGGPFLFCRMWVALVCPAKIIKIYRRTFSALLEDSTSFQLETLEWSQNRKNRTIVKIETHLALVGKLWSHPRGFRQVGPENFGIVAVDCAKSVRMVPCATTTDGFHFGTKHRRSNNRAGSAQRMTQQITRDLAS